MERAAGAASNSNALQSAEEGCQILSLTWAEIEEINELGRRESTWFLFESRNHGIAVNR